MDSIALVVLSVGVSQLQGRDRHSSGISGVEARPLTQWACYQDTCSSAGARG